VEPIAGAAAALAAGLAAASGAGACSSDSAGALTSDDTSPDGSVTSSSGAGNDGSGFIAADAGTMTADAGAFNGLECDGTPCLTAVSTGGGHACAILGDETVRCWGQNVFGELGSGTLDGGQVVPPQTTTPTAVAGLSGVLQIATGGYGVGLGVSCAVLGAGSAMPEGGTVCWGSNASGMLGLGVPADAAAGTAAPPALTITPLPLALDAVQRLALGGFFGCALVAGGDVACWGDDSQGELGRDLDGRAFDPTPTTVPLPSAATAVATGKNHACAVLADHTVMCWGAADHGAIGTVTDGGVSTPYPVQDIAATALAAGEASTCAITLTGTVACWGGNAGGQLGRGDAGTAAIDPVPALVSLPANLRAVQIASAVGSTCALLSDRSVWCWGDNAYGELGTGSAVPGFSATPAPAEGLANIVQIASGPGGLSVCALLNDATVRCWGANYADQLGVDTSGEAGPDESPHPVPLRVSF
jgi:alpha-tubulin suppressor-like RCC1 family protein